MTVLTQDMNDTTGSAGFTPVLFLSFFEQLTSPLLLKTSDAWRKEFLGFVRQQLRKILPNMRFTDADIESALSRSARAMRKRSKKAANTFTEADGSGGRTLSLVTLAPDIVTAVMTGKAPESETLTKVLYGFPDNWQEQRKFLGMGG